jgi:hypothetical protein
METPRADKNSLSTEASFKAPEVQKQNADPKPTISCSTASWMTSRALRRTNRDHFAG